MGLAISVGILADVMENDPEDADWVREEMEQVNIVLSERGLPSHVEPESLAPLETRGAMDSFPYSFLHYLRRFYARVKADSSWQPTPILENQDPIDDDPGEMLGSSVRLMNELIEVAPYLDIPLTNGHLTDETAELLAQEEEDSSPFWIERLVWFALYENARLSLEHKTAIHFG